MLTGKERLKIQDVVWLKEVGRRWELQCGSITGGWAGIEQEEEDLIF